MTTPETTSHGSSGYDVEGYRNLLKISSLSYTEGFYYKPRIDDEALAEHRSGRTLPLDADERARLA